jgi:hypothetical protein
VVGSHDELGIAVEPGNVAEDVVEGLVLADNEEDVLDLWPPQQNLLEGDSSRKHVSFSHARPREFGGWVEASARTYRRASTCCALVVSQGDQALRAFPM